MESWQETALTKIRTFVESSFSGQYEVYDLLLKPENRTLVLGILIDSPAGIRIQDCEVVSRAVEKFLDENDLIHRQYTLEVSSPGVERILKRPVDFERHLGRLVRWILKPSGETPRETLRGRLQEFAPSRIVVQAESGLREFPLDRVEEARAVFEFPSKPKHGKKGGRP